MCIRDRVYIFSRSHASSGTAHFEKLLKSLYKLREYCTIVDVEGSGTRPRLNYICILNPVNTTAMIPNCNELHKTAISKFSVEDLSNQGSLMSILFIFQTNVIYLQLATWMVSLF
eukprot:TRINITY_DN22086_c0_g3_i2.p1 TRINITY_DN22086_c0_g3~~TRINITY_DN22086_c0_g3_i2.p1  ORF type:complete len:115 (-),score=3.48 TRINITY_DN22086_c0_g3_i2:92-436(-)